MAVIRGVYSREWEFDENTVNNIFTSFQEVFGSITGFYMWVNGQWELMSGVLWVKYGSYWWNITTGERELIDTGSFPSIDALLTEDEYDTVLTTDLYDTVLI